MSDALTFFLLISTLVTGTIWFFCQIIYFKNYLINKNKIKNNLLKLEKKTCFFQSLSSFFPIFLIIFTVRAFIYEPFQIPSGSMMPTLLIGDFILVEKFSYGIREPITHKILIETNQPKRGDIVVFKHPIDYHVNYIKRVIGLPGDKIIYHKNSKHITICKNYIIKKQCKEKISINYSKIQSSDFIQKIYFSNENNLKQEKKIYNSMYFKTTEENINGVKHKILLLNNIKNKEKYYQQHGMPKLTWIVPQKKYFMMGDNRDNSLDSRYWGFVPESNLMGKAIKIWMSFDKNENEWPVGIRLNRIGNIY